MRLPTDRSEANTRTLSTGNMRSARIFSITVPTIPVAPTTATFNRLEVGTAKVYFELANWGSRTGLFLPKSFELRWRHLLGRLDLGRACVLTPLHLRDENWVHV